MEFIIITIINLFKFDSDAKNLWVQLSRPRQGLDLQDQRHT